MTDDAPPTAEEVQAKIEQALQHVYDLCNGTKKWRMCVPVQQDDSDMVLCDALRSARIYIAHAAQAVPEERERCVWDLETCPLHRGGVLDCPQPEEARHLIRAALRAGQPGHDAA